MTSLGFLSSCNSLIVLSVVQISYWECELAQGKSAGCSARTRKLAFFSFKLFEGQVIDFKSLT